MLCEKLDLAIRMTRFICQGKKRARHAVYALKMHGLLVAWLAAQLITRIAPAMLDTTAMDFLAELVSYATLMPKQQNHAQVWKALIL